MSDDRWLVLGLAHPRARWFSELSYWATTSAVPIDFVKCVSAGEVQARLSSSETIYSAVLASDNTRGVNVDLIDAANTAGAAVIIVDPVTETDWGELGASGVLSADFDREDLIASLREHANPISRAPAPGVLQPLGTTETVWHGHLLAITGTGGSGKSTIAMALAQKLADSPSNQGFVLLADLARHGEQAMLHDAGEVAPGIQELIEAHRLGRLPTEGIRTMVFDTADRGYHLLLGLRRHRDWSEIRPKAFEAALDGLLRSYRHVVADVDCDIEGETETGSIDVATRNLLARTTLRCADLVLVVGVPGLKGIHSMARTLRDLLDFGIAAPRLIPIVNRAPRGPHRRSDLLEALAELSGPDDTTVNIGNPILLPERRNIDDLVIDGLRLPDSFAVRIGAEVQRRLESLDPRRSPDNDKPATLTDDSGSPDMAISGAG